MKAFSFASGRLRIMLHLLAWTILLGLPLYFYKRWQVGTDFIWIYYINTLIAGTIFYLNYLLFLPKLFFRNKRHLYFLAAFFTLLAFYFVSGKSNELVFKNISGRQNTEEIRRPPPEGRDHPRPPFRQIHMFNYTFTSVFMLFFAMGLRVLERQSLIEKLQKEMEKEKLDSELAFLKNQISPHFFFNTLNNIYALIEINTEDAQKAVLKLSKLMRYLLYESEHGNTRLSNEIDFMLNYIDLMKLRMNEKIKLSFSFPKVYEDINFPPLIFVPFIENAFKHGISYRQKSFISIEMHIEGNTISFRCSNSMVDKVGENETEQPGIGLENVKKRLKLLFPGKYELRIDPSEDKFEVFVKINYAS
ncbi:MAG: histidine kinase [Bacteroidota bacterium]